MEHIDAACRFNCGCEVKRSMIEFPHFGVYRGWFFKKHIIVGVVVLSFCQGLYAQPRPDQFFPRDHVRGGAMLKDKEQNRERGGGESSIPATVINPNGAVEKRADPFVEMGDEDTQEEFLAAADDKVSGIKIEALGAIFSTDDQKELEKQVNHLIKIAFRRDIPLAAIYAVGADNPNVRGNNEVMNALWILGGSLVGLPALVSPYDQYVEHTPSWIVYTNRGQFVLEGVAAPERFINSRGEYVENLGVSQSVVKIEEKSVIDLGVEQGKREAERDPLKAIEAARQANSDEARRLITSMTEEE